LWTADTSSIPSFAPTNLVAVAQGTSSVSLTWNVYSGATSYQLFKSSLGAVFTQVPVTITTNSYNDPSVIAGRTYLYRVRAVTAAGPTDLSNVDLATTVTFADDNALPGGLVLATHLQQIRDATNYVLTAANLPTISFGSLTAGVTTIQATDITTVRNSLVNAYYSIGLPIPTFGSGPITVGATVVKVIHFQELRNLVK